MLLAHRPSAGTPCSCSQPRGDPATCHDHSCGWQVAFILAGFVTVGSGATSNCDFNTEPGEHERKTRAAFTGN